MIPKIKISDFDYPLPFEKIAQFPLPNRDSSKLLIYRDEKIVDDNFYNLASHLDSNSILVFNDTKVVPARLFFKKKTGAIIEILCLNPTNPKEYVNSFVSIGACEWKVIVGNAKKWKDGDIEFIGNEEVGLDLKAQLIEKGDESIVKFKWNSPITFSEVLDKCGNLPIPPYLNRDTQAIDKERYQTIYAKHQGSVAAPTAGLHFSENVFNSFKNKNITTHSVCLHVGAGTFIPVKSEYIGEHNMHIEPFSVKKELLTCLLNNIDKYKIVSVGTTSTRTLESLYYIGVQLIENPYSPPKIVEQWAPYIRDYAYSFKEAISAIISYLERNNLERLVCGTSIIIVPGFRFRVVDVQITNFHQPKSTLLLLISAIIGDKWGELYTHALRNGYRFLSYGDSSVLFNKNKISDNKIY